MILSFRILVFSLLSVSLFQPSNQRISLHLVSKTLKNGKVITLESDIFYLGNEQKMTTHFIKPLNYIMINTVTGESKIYNPEKNEVQMLQHSFLKTGNNLLYFFFTNQLQDLGMKEAGYRLVNTRKEGKALVSIFQPDPDKKSEVTKVEMVHENYAPVYAAFYNVKGAISRKIYYSDYKALTGFLLPGRITEINFQSPKDSIISRTIFSDIKTGSQASGEYFNFEIPMNARVIK